MKISWFLIKKRIHLLLLSRIMIVLKIIIGLVFIVLGFLVAFKFTEQFTFTAEIITTIILIILGAILLAYGIVELQCYSDYKTKIIGLKKELNMESYKPLALKVGNNMIDFIKHLEDLSDEKRN